MDDQIKLPLLLEPWREKIEATVTPFIKIEPQPAGATQAWESRIGGFPYLPAYAEFPKNKKGEALFFLAQINFAEMHPLDGFPEKGLLQFYINDDGLMGLDVHDGKEGDFKLLYFEEVSEEPADFQKIEKMPREYDCLPIAPGKSFPLRFSPNSEVLPLGDFRFGQLFGDDFFAPFGDGQWDLMDQYQKANNARGHKIGGYAHFTQQDPRYGPDAAAELLFQLDSDQAIGCLWGDMGVANFFIRKDDLERRDFSRVLYNWDCY